MKRIFLFSALLCIFTLGSTNHLSAQGKYGHVNSSELLTSMPGIDSVSIKLQAFQSELQGLYEDYMAEYQAKVTKFDKEAGTMSSSVRQIREKEIQDLQNRIQEFQYSVQEDLESKQFELVKPFQDKIQNAIKEVAKENNYTYVFDTQVLLYSDGGVDITPLVKKKLGINK